MTPTPLTPAEREEWAERAGIIEYEAGLSRAEAERQALDLIIGKRQRADRQRDLGFAASDAVVVG